MLFKSDRYSRIRNKSITYKRKKKWPENYGYIIQNSKKVN